jgi:hypothetical protein
MSELIKEEKIKNIFTFLTIVFGDDLHLSSKLINMTPDYLIEKFERYVLSHQYEADWGLHPGLRRGVFDKYCIKYKLKITSYDDYENDILNACKLKEE